jgi:hypothetical protein
MAAWGKIQDVAIGRAFDAAGLLGRFLAWVTLPQASHGPGWYLIDDQSTLPTDPYVVVATAPLPWAFPAWPKILKVQLLTATAATVEVSPLYFYDVATKAQARWTYARLHTLDAAGFPFWYRGGPEALAAITFPGGDATPSWFLYDDLGANDNECESQSHSGTSVDSAYIESGDSGNLISGWDNLSGLDSTTTDANGNIYLSIVFVSGANYRFDLFRDSGRTQRVGFTGNFTGTTTGARSFTADTTYSHGVTGTLSNIATVSANTSISCRTRFLTLQGGEGANITVGRYYFLVDFSAYTMRISFSKVRAKTGDLIEFEDLRSGLAFGLGTFVSPYPLRHYFHANRNQTTAVLTNWGFSLPFLGKRNSEYPATMTGWNSGSADISTAIVNRLSPDLYGKYRVTRGLIYENLDHTGSPAGLVSVWGYPKNGVYGSSSFITLLNSGRSEDGIDYLAVHIWASGYLMIRDSESAS